MRACGAGAGPSGPIVGFQLTFLPTSIRWVMGTLHPAGWAGLGELGWFGLGWSCGCVLPVPWVWRGGSWDARGLARARLLVRLPVVTGPCSHQQCLEGLVAAGLPVVMGKWHPCNCA